MNFKVTVASCEKVTIDGKDYYKVFAVLPNGGLIRIRGCRTSVKAGSTLNVEVRSKGDKAGFEPMLTVINSEPF